MNGGKALSYIRRGPVLAAFGVAAGAVAYGLDAPRQRASTASTAAGFKALSLPARNVAYCDDKDPRIVPRRLTLDDLLFGTTHTAFEIRYAADNDVDAYMRAVEAAHPDKAVFALFVADKTNGKSWCGDCRRAEPVLAEVFNRHWRDVIVVVFDVDRQAYRHPSKRHPYRLHPQVGLKCVPTLHA
jgi:thiol-disulfide isomerase/thioredoxin